jgi:Zn ribbon nucleic-acid-binding protein
VYGARDVHDCCAVYGVPCPACAQSDENERRWQEHGRAWAERVKRHWHDEARRAEAVNRRGRGEEE